jgi:hypothetical protein
MRPFRNQTVSETIQGSRRKSVLFEYPGAVTALKTGGLRNDAPVIRPLVEVFLKGDGGTQEYTTISASMRTCPTGGHRRPSEARCDARAVGHATVLMRGGTWVRCPPSWRIMTPLARVRHFDATSNELNFLDSMCCGWRRGWDLCQVTTRRARRAMPEDHTKRQFSQRESWRRGWDSNLAKSLPSTTYGISETLKTPETLKTVRVGTIQER